MRDDEARVRSARRVAAALRAPEVEGFPILGEGEDVQTLDMKAADQELLGSRKFDREQIAAIYRVPPAKLQMMEYGVKANGEQQAIDYLTDCLLHWAKQVEDQLALGVLTEAERRAGLFFRHDFGGPAPADNQGEIRGARQGGGRPDPDPRTRPGASTATIRSRAATG